MEIMNMPLVSIIVRTCNRPDVLRVALDSLCNQTYSEIEIIVAEDGIDTASSVIKSEYPELNVVYCCSGEKVGRCKIGNIALEKATGKYINFLDDDDCLYPDHIEKLVGALEKSKCLAAYSIAEEIQIIVKSRSPYIFKEKRRFIRNAQPFNKILLYYTNYFPIQSVMFDRVLYEKLGGLNEQIDVFEDWELWARYATVTNFEYIDEVTSAYYISYEKNKKKQRDATFREAREDIIERFIDYKIDIDGKQISDEMKFIIKQYKTGQFIRVIKKVGNWILYGER